MNQLAKNSLIDKYGQDTRLKEIDRIFETQQPAYLRATSVFGAQECFIVRGLYERKKRPFLIIAENKETAAYFWNTLSLLFDKKQIFFLPDSFKRPTHFEEMNKPNILERTEVVSALYDKAGSTVIVTYPEALFEKVVNPAELEKTRLSFSKGEKLDRDFIVEVLLDYGFSREEFVYEPGQFSIRGGIIDIYSFGNELPYRIELFDDEVERIRSFDPMSQLSQQELFKVSIVPNMNKRFEKSDKIAFTEILLPETLVIVWDMNLLHEKLKICEEKASDFSKTISILHESEEAEFAREKPYVKPDVLLSALITKSILFFSARNQPVPIPNQIDFSGKPQPQFNRNFDLLITDWKERQAKKQEIYLFTENARQVERFHAIFEDMKADLIFHPVIMGLHEGFIDEGLGIACFTDHQIFNRFHRFKLRHTYSRDQALQLKIVKELQPGDFVSHIDYGIGKFSGLQKIEINGNLQEAVRLFYKNNDILYVSVNSLHKISKYVGKEGTEPQLSKLGSDAWKNLKNKTKKKLKDIAAELIKLYAQRRAAPGFAFPPDSYLQDELEASFIYEDTPDQYKATVDVKADMMKPYPMDRLICGDVGFGKTEIAIRAAFKSVVAGKQVAILVPTTILALQHAKTFHGRLEPFGVTVDYVNRFRSTKERKETFAKLAEGKVDIIIGTHSLLGKDTHFKDLGLLVIDEEQKFGVASKEKLRSLKTDVDTLTLTATPIPRTLQFSLMAARDLSIIRTPPPNRQPIQTEVHAFNEELIRDAIYYEVNRGGQVFFVHNRVKNLEEMSVLIKKLCPDISIGFAHGQLESSKLETTLMDFIDKKYDVLVCTNIIETGLDIANANTMIINNAHQFGLSDLHQLRGRVGRSNKKAYCYLLSPSMSSLTDDARKRLKTLEDFSELGSGFQIAMKDLDIRGAGNILGAEQSGFIADIGYETYQKILEEAVQELKETDYKDLFREELEKDRKFVRDVQIETDIDLFIPDSYVSNVQERLSMYTQIDQIETEEQIDDFISQMEDRFGRVPHQIHELFEGLRLRWICKKIGFERIILKGNKLRCYFIDNPQSPYYESPQFQKVLQYVAGSGKKEGLLIKKSTTNLMLIHENIRSLEKAKILLNRIAGEINQ
jgi:transcription-repair coupling factor (superfamily II helicase)